MRCVATGLVLAPLLTVTARLASSEASSTEFQLELEFVQCLANPRYVNYLAQHQLLSDPSLVAYLAYLHAHWSRPEYSRCLSHPASLAALELLQSPEVRAAMASPDATEHVWRQQFYDWQFGGPPLWAAQAAHWRGVQADAAARDEPR